MQIRLISVFFIVLCHLANGQRFYTLDDDKSYIDSLEKIIVETKSDSVRCLNLFKLSDIFLRNRSVELYKDYLKKANTIAPQNTFLSDLSVYYNASTYLADRDMEGYGKQLTEANEKLKKYSLPVAFSMRAFIFKNLAVLQQMKDNEGEATRILINEAIPLAKKSKDLEVMCTIYTNLGIIFMNNGNREKANDYFGMAINSAERALVHSHQFLEIKLQAYINYAENATQLNKAEEAKQSLNKAFEILKKYPESNLNGIFYQAKGLLQHGLNNFEEAIKSYDLGIKNCERHHDKSLAKSLKFVKAQSLSNLQKYAQARDILMEMDTEGHQSAEDTKMYYNQIIINCDKMGDMKNAYKYSKKYIQLTDSLYRSNTKREITELEAKYNTAEKEKEINQLEAQRQKTIITSERNYILFGSLSFVLLLVVAFLWKNTINQKKLAVEIEKNYAQKLLALKNQKEIEIMQATISGEEKERKRIARDLHDGIGSRLSTLKMRLANTLKNDTTNQSEQETISDLLNVSISELRQVAYNLVPETLLKLGLEHALSDLCYSLRTPSLGIVFHAGEIKQSISESNQITIFRIVQELINNALKHSECTEIIVDCSQNQNLFLITVEDNGVGFNAEMTDEYLGLGLKNLKNRVALLNGKMEILSALGKGATFNIELNIEMINGQSV